MATSFRPLRADPTRTGFLRKRFEADLRRRLLAIKRKILELVIDEDAFGLAKPPFPGGGISVDMRFSAALAGNVSFAFLSRADQLLAFQAWLRQQIASEYATAEELWRKFIQDGFNKGAGRTFQDVRAKLDLARPDFYKGTSEEFLQSSFARPVAVEKLNLLTSRVFTELAGVTEQMAVKMTGVLADGLVQGQSPREIARTLASEVDDLGIKRSRTIARTEIIRAHAEGQLQAMEDLGVTEVGVQVEWLTARDSKVCPKCRPLEGIVLKLEEARGMLPRHPNCRCAWIPANVGESMEGQARTKGDIQARVEEAGGGFNRIAKRRPTANVVTEDYAAIRTFEEALRWLT